MRPSALLLPLFLFGILTGPPPARAQSGGPGQSALNNEMRISTMEDQMRQLNGRVEELTNLTNQLKQQLNRLSSDVDVRFNQLGGSAPSSEQAPTLQPPSSLNSASAPLPPQPKPQPGAGADPSQPASRSGTLGTVTASVPPAALPGGSAQDQYNYAMGLLTQANYPAAEQAMRSFVQRYPNDSLAGNAQYWLGETFYVRKDYSNAATAFAQGYEKYPKGPKAPDDLLKLGMSLTALNQKSDACRAYQRLDRDFPVMPQSIKDALPSEKRRAGC